MNTERNPRERKPTEKMALLQQDKKTLKNEGDSNPEHEDEYILQLCLQQSKTKRDVEVTPQKSNF